MGTYKYFLYLILFTVLFNLNSFADPRGVHLDSELFLAKSINGEFELRIKYINSGNTKLYINLPNNDELKLFDHITLKVDNVEVARIYKLHEEVEYILSKKITLKKYEMYTFKINPKSVFVVPTDWEKIEISPSGVLDYSKVEPIVMTREVWDQL